MTTQKCLTVAKKKILQERSWGISSVGSEGGFCRAEHARVKSQGSTGRSDPRDTLNKGAKRREGTGFWNKMDKVETGPLRATFWSSPD